MSEVKDGMCIIDAISGIDCATPQIGQFTDNFDKVKFLLGKDFNDYTMIIVTDINGHVEIVNTDGENLIKESTDGETNLVWNIGANITSESGVVIYQIVAYKENGENIEKVWYSKEGRLIVTESISTNEYSASLIGSYPNLLTRLLIDIGALQKELETRCNQKVDIVEGMGLSQNSFSDEEKEKLFAIEEGAEVNVTSDWQEDDENSDSYIKNKPILASVATSGSYTDLKDKPIVDNAYNSESQNAQSGTAVAQAIAQLVNSSPEALNTLYELANALGNDPNFATTVAKQIGTKVDKVDGKELSSNDYTDAEKEKLASVQQGAEKNVISDWAEEDANSDKFIKNKPQLSEVALSGSYNDLSDKPVYASVAKSGSYRDLSDTPHIPNIEGLASEEYVNEGLKDKVDKTTKINGKAILDGINLSADDVGALPSDKIVGGFGVPFDVSGTNLVTIDKVHPKEHDVEVKVESINLLNDTDFKSSMTIRGIIADYEGDGIFHIHGTSNGGETSLLFSFEREIDPNENYTLYVMFLEGTTSKTFYPYIGVYNGVQKRNYIDVSITPDSSVGTTYSKTAKPSAHLSDATHIKDLWLYSYFSAGDTLDCRVQVWLEKGVAKSEPCYVPFEIDCDSVTVYGNDPSEINTYPVTDGKAIVKSVSPTMSIEVSVMDVNIKAKGYQDGLAIIDELKQAILSLGGNI